MEHLFQPTMKEAPDAETETNGGLLYLPECSCGWTGPVWKDSIVMAQLSWREFHASTTGEWR